MLIDLGVNNNLSKNFYCQMAGRNSLTLNEKIKVINVQEQEKLSVRKIAKRYCNKTKHLKKACLITYKFIFKD